MWPDNDTDTDFLNFAGVADTIAEIIVQARGRPISIGVSGAWGTGKSSLVRLTRAAFEARPKTEKDATFVFVEFNAWLYQGYDDARAALADVVATRLADEAQTQKKGLDKAKELLQRVNWLRAAKFSGSLLPLLFGAPPLGLASEALAAGKKILGGGDEGAAGGWLKPKEDVSPPKEIEALRLAFAETVSALGVVLVVLIDDLDRCLPETAISTLEAIRLLLFIRDTAFVIAADNEMIKHAVKRHFEGIDDRFATNYFDKLIQVPIRVPPLGTQEVRAYMLLLFIQNAPFGLEVKEKVRKAVIGQLRHAWQGKRVDSSFVRSLHSPFSDALVAQLDTADRLAPLMTSASGIAGNPRLIKRFLNGLAIRMSISKAQGVGVDEAVLAKLMLFERVGDPRAYAEIVGAVSASTSGAPEFLDEWEATAHAGGALSLKEPWSDPFVSEWLALPPRLAELDLRGALYVSREHVPLITPEDRLSSEGAELLTAALEHPDMAAGLHDRIAALPRPELNVIMDRLLERARQEQQWGAPPILDACLVVAGADPGQGARLAAFLSDRPHPQIQPNIVPKIGEYPWAVSLFDAWKKGSVSRQVKAAIKEQVDNGDIAVK